MQISDVTSFAPLLTFCFHLIYLTFRLPLIFFFKHISITSTIVLFSESSFALFIYFFVLFRNESDNKK